MRNKITVGAPYVKNPEERKMTSEELRGLPVPTVRFGVQAFKDAHAYAIEQSEAAIEHMQEVLDKKEALNRDDFKACLIAGGLTVVMLVLDLLLKVRGAIFIGSASMAIVFATAAVRRRRLSKEFNAAAEECERWQAEATRIREDFEAGNGRMFLN